MEKETKNRIRKLFTDGTPEAIMKETGDVRKVAEYGYNLAVNRISRLLHKGQPWIDINISYSGLDGIKSSLTNEYDEEDEE